MAIYGGASIVFSVFAVLIGLFSGFVTLSLALRSRRVISIAEVAGEARLREVYRLGILRFGVLVCVFTLWFAGLFIGSMKLGVRLESGNVLSIAASDGQLFGSYNNGRHRWDFSHWQTTVHCELTDEVLRMSDRSWPLDLWRQSLNYTSLVNWPVVGSHFWRAGFGCETVLIYDAAGTPQLDRRNACVPLWFIALVVVFPVVRTQIRGYLRRGVSPGLCRYCGYDLRGTPTRCPECGTSATVVRLPKESVKDMGVGSLIGGEPRLITHNETGPIVFPAER